MPQCPRYKHRMDVYDMVHAAVYLESGSKKEHLQAEVMETQVEPIMQIFGAGCNIQKGAIYLCTTGNLRLALGIWGQDGLPSHVLDRQCKESVA